MSTRRTLICAIAGALLAAGRAGRAQTPGKVYRIGWLSSGPWAGTPGRVGVRRELGPARRQRHWPGRTGPRGAREATGAAQGSSPESVAHREPVQSSALVPCGNRCRSRADGAQCRRHAATDRAAFARRYRRRIRDAFEGWAPCSISSPKPGGAFCPSISMGRSTHASSSLARCATAASLARS